MADLRADVLVAHVRTPTVGTLRTENTHPFRFRQWLFAQTGTVPEFAAVRDRLVATIRGCEIEEQVIFDTKDVREFSFELKLSEQDLVRDTGVPFAIKVFFE